MFDLGKLEYLSSAGIRCFVRARKAIEPSGDEVAVVNPQPPVRKILEVVKAVPEDGIFASVEERLRDERCARRHGDDQVAPVGSTSDDQI